MADRIHMNRLGQVVGQMETVDDVLLMLVENTREGGKLATPIRITKAIGGAPRSKVKHHLDRLVHLGALDLEDGYRLTQLGAGALESRIEDWEPGHKEQTRRDDEMMTAARSRMPG